MGILNRMFHDVSFACDEGKHGECGWGVGACGCYCHKEKSDNARIKQEQKAGDNDAG